LHPAINEHAATEIPANAEEGVSVPGADQAHLQCYVHPFEATAANVTVRPQALPVNNVSCVNLVDGLQPAP